MYPMKPARLFIVCALLAASVPALAQYQWIDKDGRSVFSDRAPPAEVPARNILAQPRGASVPVAAAATAPASATPQAAAASASATGTDKALEEKKKQAEAADAAKKKADEARLAAARADNCKRAQSAKTTLDSGMRMARVNDKGEREILDDQQRAAELQRTNQAIAENCK